MDILIRWGKNDKNGIKLPILPESYKVDGKQQNTSVNVHATGEMNLKGKRALMTISWSSFFPGNKNSHSSLDYHNDYHDPIKYYVYYFEKLLAQNTTIHIVIGKRINIFGTIESFSWGESDGGGDIYYDVSIKEQRGLTLKKMLKTGYSVTVEWKKGDTWKKLCKKYLADESLAGQNRALKANAATIAKAIKAYKKTKAYKKQAKKKKTVDEAVALIGYKVVLKL